MRKLPLALGALFALGNLLGAPVAAGGTIYEWTLNGQKYATDRPPPPGAKLVRVTQERSGPSNPPAAPRPATGASTAPAPDLESTARQVAQDVAKVQSDRCAEARQRYTNYLQAQRLFKPGPNNERQYLTDAELSAARVNAQREMDQACQGP